MASALTAPMPDSTSTMKLMRLSSLAIRLANASRILTPSTTAVTVNAAVSVSGTITSQPPNASSNPRYSSANGMSNTARNAWPE